MPRNLFIGHTQPLCDVLFTLMLLQDIEVRGEFFYLQKRLRLAHVYSKCDRYVLEHISLFRLTKFHHIDE
jgi:hypothetical protein